MKKMLFVSLLSLILLPGCIEELDTAFPNRADFLVVDGILNYDSEADSMDYVVYLNLSSTIYTRAFPLSGATMELIVNEQETYPFIEKRTGEYFLSTLDVFQAGNTYQLRFQIEEDVYESSLEIMPDAVPLGKVYAEINEEGTAEDAYELFVDMEDDPDKKNYYRWLITQWEKQLFCQFCYKENFRTPEECYISLYPSPNATLSRNNFCDGDCFGIYRITPNNAISDQFIEGKSLIKKSVGFVPLNLSRPCLVEVKQSSLTVGYFEFLEILRSQAESTGGLADTPPALLTGNVKNVNNPREKVVGYFSVTNNTVLRYWLDREEAILAGFTPLGNQNPPLSPPVPTPPDWQPIPCEPGENRTPIKPWGWQD